MPIFRVEVSRVVEMVVSKTIEIIATDKDAAEYIALDQYLEGHFQLTPKDGTWTSINSADAFAEIIHPSIHHSDAS